MNLRMVGCTHRDANLDIRQLLAFGPQEIAAALQTWQTRLPLAELVLLSTCNRVELYAAGADPESLPTADELVEALLAFRNVPKEQFEGHLTTLADRDVVEHVYRVASSLESMVVGEPQILAQVKRAYQQANEVGATGPLLHEVFQTALRTAKRVAGETSLHRHRVSIPSVAIADLASCMFESFDDKQVLVLGAGEMAEETLRYLRDQGQPRIHVVNRNAERGRQLAETCDGAFHPWEQLWDQLVLADLVISTTAADEPIVSAAAFAEHVEPRRHQRPLFILDLAVPRDFSPDVGEVLGVYLYSLDDLTEACQRNLAARAAEMPAAEKIVNEETARFVAEALHRATAPVISGLCRGMHEPKQAELERLFRKLPQLDENSRAEIEQFAERLVNKMLHPPLESLRHATQNGTHHGLLDAMKRLFKLED
ncbi:MAG: glutamyl-tRNA reductase [Planctomycetes bacterium]|nr:glutamyl-tRNA reductase [Planctomycetota bacterium]